MYLQILQILEDNSSMNIMPKEPNINQLLCFTSF